MLNDVIRKMERAATYSCYAARRIGLGSLLKASTARGDLTQTLT